MINHIYLPVQTKQDRVAMADCLVYKAQTLHDHTCAVLLTVRERPPFAEQARVRLEARYELAECALLL